MIVDTIETILAAGNQNCCGCGTCMRVCPTGAITMIPKELGCLYPQIDSQKCVGCAACVQSCAMLHRAARTDVRPAAFAAMARDEQLLKKSASGGVFASLAGAILDQGGAVFGCSLEQRDGSLTPVHICVEHKQDLEKLQGSKYVQSDLDDAFLQVKQLLKTSRTVLFSGTPCQVDALKRFLRHTDTTNLLTMDLVCHGVPSAKLFREYLGTFRTPVDTFSFRDKASGWGLNGRYTYRMHGKSKEKVFSPGISSYYTYFLQAETYRESCYSCRYANMDRVGDITIGDYWGIEQEHPELLSANGGPCDIRKGISLILVNTKKGEYLLNQFGRCLILTDSSPEAVSKWNHQLYAPSQHSAVRDMILRQYDTEGYTGIEKLFRKKLGIRWYIRKAKGLVHQHNKQSLKMKHHPSAAGRCTTFHVKEKFYPEDDSDHV